MPHRRSIAVVLMTLAGLAGRASALLSNIIVGVFLTQQEIGTYAVAVGILGFTAMLRAGGSAHYLPTIRPEDYDREAGRIFWWGLLFLMLGAVATWAAAAAIPFMPNVHAPPMLDAAKACGPAGRGWVCNTPPMISPTRCSGRFSSSVYGSGFLGTSDMAWLPG